ncbi:methyltransferase [Catenulispora pinisilvae]|uniref:methyltransferase n=1 Tax=Catenulispora pinisilvae TaxID=2705253 RepID=UPI001891CA34|nr:methyltransferase [Catenulispora pinisilvae]
MGGEYWQAEPDGPARERTVRLDVPGRAESLPLATADGVFGTQRVDRGTGVLIRHAPAPAPGTGVVDVGCGYGPIAVAMGLRQPAAGVWAVDVNRRALALTARNAATAGAHNIVTAEPEGIPAALRFDRIYSHPPIKIGRSSMHELLDGWLRRLAHGGDAFLVVKQSMGADSLHSWLTDSGYEAARAASKQGYRLLRVHTNADSPQPAGLTPADLRTIARSTGRTWNVLGRLAGGRSDSVQLLGSGEDRAVAKIKLGAWWGPQLAELEATAAELAEAGYPTPAILAHGPLAGDERHFLLTAFEPDAEPAPADATFLAQAAAAVGRQAGVRPRPDRDWSAMVTLFLNGGITEHEFHPDLAGLAARALALVPHPVPALPSTEFVHGDFTTANLLSRDGALSAVIDLEGFGRGTRTIDLVSLLASVVGDAPAPAVQALARDAVAASDEATFRACLAHRVLASLLSATDFPERIAEVSERARLLLALAD